MFKKISNIVFLAFVCFLIICPVKVSAKDYTLNDLVENGKSLDGMEIGVKGEAVGEVMDRGNHSWVNINDTTNAMGIYMSKDDSLKVVNYGGFNKSGDVLDVVGTFNRACKEHGGDMDIHAKSVKVVKEGSDVFNVVPREKFVLASVMPVMTAVMGYFLYRRNRVCK